MAEQPHDSLVEPRPVVRQSLREQVRDEIVRLIVNGRLAPGANVNEQRLAELLGVSRTPVREALLGLEREGVIYTDGPRGFFVQPLTADEVREVYPILWALEELAVRSVGRYRPELLDELRRLNAEMAAGPHDPHSAIDDDNRWHRLLTGACGNERLLALLETLKQAVRRYEYAYMATEGLTKRSIAQHDDIVSALEADDIDTAIERLRDNFRISLDFFVEQLADDEGTDDAAA